MRNVLKKLAATGVVAASALAMSMVGATSAEANSQYGCPYPYVCIYGGGGSSYPIVAEFKDVTDYFQNTNHGDVWWVVNTRNQDYTHIQRSDGFVFCVPPNGNLGGGGTITGIMISNGGSC
ncbi:MULTISPECIES: hypothetical protein [unclassified Kitasatospora]|uniref:hypothetical protein n=1 Tax=unclassified Kitasatospora TaxID=2633591 RepID=UPI00340B0293